MLALLLLGPTVTEAAPAPSPAPAPATLESLLLAKLLFLKGMVVMEATKPMTIEKKLPLNCCQHTIYVYVLNFIFLNFRLSGRPIPSFKQCKSQIRSKNSLSQTGVEMLHF